MSRTATTEIPAAILEIASRLVTQDNRATDCPIFIVQEKRRTYGFDTNYADDANVAWLNDPNDHAEASPEEHARLEAAWDETGDEPMDWTRTAYLDTWEYVTTCFTEDGCNEYIRVNRHNHSGELRIYAAGSWRNEEWRAVRDWLVAIAAPPAPTEPLFYILSMRRPTPYVLTWYRPGKNGYTVHLDSAGKFTRAEVQGEISANDVLVVPCEVADARVGVMVPDEFIGEMRAAALKVGQ